MEYLREWTPLQVYENCDGERLRVESELELQIWKWALLEAHLWEASQVYESLMGSPLAPRTQGELLHHSLEEWHPAEGGGLWTHPVGTAAAPRGDAKEGELSSTKGAVPGFLVKVMAWSRPRSEGRGKIC